MSVSINFNRIENVIYYGRPTNWWGKISRPCRQIEQIGKLIFFLSYFRPNFVLFGVKFHIYLFLPIMALLKRQEDCPKDSRGVIDI